MPANDDVVAPRGQDPGAASPSGSPSGGDGLESAEALPPQLAFLTAHGLSSNALRGVAAQASRWATSPEQALFAAGMMSPDTFYRAVSLEIGAPFSADALQRGSLRLGAEAAFPESIIAGMAPAMDRHGRRLFVMAPQGDTLVRLLRRRLQAGNVAIVTPAALSSAVMRLHGAAIAHDAGHGLADARPALSCREGLSRAQRMVLVAGVLLFIVCAAMAPMVLAAAFALVFLSHATVRLAAAFASWPVAPAPPPCPDRELPVYTVIVPVYGEANMAAHVLNALERLDYPRSLLDVKVVVEADDHATRNAFTSLGLPAFVQLVVAPPGAPRTKPRALNVALALARSEFTTIYDAEDAPDPDQLRKAVATFRAGEADIACLQGHLAVDNSADGWLPACFALEYAALFDAINPGLARLGLPVPLGGTSNHFRTAVLRELMGWDAWNVTEDADLGLRLARSGWRVADLDSSTLEEAPVTVGAWLAQRTRWLKGWMQVGITHTRQPARMVRELGPVAAWAAAAQCAGVVLSTLGFPFFAMFTGAQIAFGGLLQAQDWQSRLGLASACAVLVSGLVAGIAPLVVGARKRGVLRLLALMPLLPFYYGLASLAAWRALIEQVRDPGRWNKTAHGVARSSGSGRLGYAATYTSGTQLRPRPGGASD